MFDNLVNPNFVFHFLRFLLAVLAAICIIVYADLISAVQPSPRFGLLSCVLVESFVVWLLFYLGGRIIRYNAFTSLYNRLFTTDKGVDRFVFSIAVTSVIYSLYLLVRFWFYDIILDRQFSSFVLPVIFSLSYLVLIVLEFKRRPINSIVFEVSEDADLDCNLAIPVVDDLYVEPVVDVDDSAIGFIDVRDGHHVWPKNINDFRLFTLDNAKVVGLTATNVSLRLDYRSLKQLSLLLVGHPDFYTTGSWIVHRSVIERVESSAKYQGRTVYLMKPFAGHLLLPKREVSRFNVWYNSTGLL